MKGFAIVLGLSLIAGTRLSAAEVLLFGVAALVVLGFVGFILNRPERPMGEQSAHRRDSIRLLHNLRFGIRSLGLVWIAVVIGLCYGHWWAQERLSHRLPASLDRTEVSLLVRVESIRERDRWQTIEVEVLCQGSGERTDRNTASDLPTLTRLQLNVYGNRQKSEDQTQALSSSGEVSEIAVGDVVAVEARLRAIRNFENGLAFDYEAYQLRRGVDARGYVRSMARDVNGIKERFPVCASSREANGLGGLLGRWLKWRSDLLGLLEKRLDNYQTRSDQVVSEKTGLAVQSHGTAKERAEERVRERARAWILGLVLGDQSAFSAEQWRLAQSTGTLHLLVVSGLHLGAFAAMAMLLSAVVQRGLALSGVLTNGHGRLLGRYALVAAISLLYVVVAGSGIALQRAWIMLMLFLLLLVWSRRLQADAILAYVFVLVLLVNPLIYTSAGFWFSMVAAGSLLLFFRGRQAGILHSLWLPQLLVFVVLTPVMLLWDSSVSLSHLPSNVWAIPMMVFVILPITGLAALGLLTAPDSFLTDWFLSLLGDLDGVWWHILTATTQVPWPELNNLPLASLIAVVGLIVTVYLGVRPLLAFVGGVVVATVLWMVPGESQNRLVMVDVGQGLSVVAMSEGKSWVYDTGPRFSDAFNAGTAMVLPVIKRLGVAQIDELIVSHDDLDHSGGLVPVLQTGFPVKRLWAGQALSGLKDLKRQAFDCHGVSSDVSSRASSDAPLGDVSFSNASFGDDAWQVVTPFVRFRFFGVSQEMRINDNDASCVVQLEWYGVRVMFSGDAGVEVERYLARRYGARLKSDVLVVGHHGSRSSTSDAWLETVRPSGAWVSAGWHNRYGHPAAEVLDRLRRYGVRVLNTADGGAIWRDADGRSWVQRELSRPIWRQQ